MKSIQDIINHYKKELDKPMRDIDNDELEENRQHRFNQRLQRRLINPDRDYPDSYHRQDVLEGIVDISDVTDGCQNGRCFRRPEFCKCSDISEGEEE